MFAKVMHIPLPVYWAALSLIWAVPTAATPHIQQWQLENGTRVYFVEAHELPILDWKVIFDAGSARDGALPGVASLTNNLLDQGASEWDANALAEEFSRLGARLSTDSARDMAVISLRTLAQPSILESVADRLAAVITHPTFPVDACERERSHTQTALEEEEQSPNDLATNALYSAIYGDHPYAHSSLGTRSGVAALTREALMAFHREKYVGHNAVVAMVGDLAPPAAMAFVQRILGRLPAGEAPPLLPVVPTLSSGTTTIIPFPSTQTHVLSGQPGIWRGDPDYFPLYLGNHILGGNGLISRIAEEIREKRGLSYSAYSQFQPMRVAGPFMMGLQTKNKQAEEARQVLQQTLERFIKEGPTEKELRDAKQNITGGFALRLDSNQKVLDYLGMIAFYRLSLDYLDRFQANVEAVTTEQIRDSFQRRIDPVHLATVVVGGK